MRTADKLEDLTPNRPGIRRLSNGNCLSRADAGTGSAAHTHATRLMVRGGNLLEYAAVNRRDGPYT